MRDSVLDRRQFVYDHALLPSLRLLEEAVYKTAHPEVFKIEKPTNKMCFSEVKYIMPAVSSHRAGGLHPITLAQEMPKVPNGIVRQIKSRRSAERLPSYDFHQ